MGLSPEDYIDIQQLLARYTHAADFEGAEKMADIFVADGRFEIAAMDIDISGIDNIIDFFNSMRDNMAGVYHLTSNLVLQGDGDSATAVSYLQILQTGDETKINGFARYADQLVKTAAGWRLQSRKIEM